MQLTEVYSRGGEVETRGQANVVIPSGKAILVDTVQTQQVTGRPGGQPITFGDILYVPSGSVSAPGIAFAAQHNAGLYYSTNQVNICAQGAQSTGHAAGSLAVNGSTTTNLVYMNERSVFNPGAEVGTIQTRDNGSGHAQLIAVMGTNNTVVVLATGV